MKIGARIKNRRMELGLSVDDVCKKLGKNRATIYRYENNEIENLPLNILEPLAKVLQTTPSYLMGWEEENAEFYYNKSLEAVYEVIEEHGYHIESINEYGQHFICNIEDESFVGKYSERELIEFACDLNTHRFNLSQKEQNIIKQYRKLDEEDKIKIAIRLEIYLENEKYSIKKESYNT